MNPEELPAGLDNDEHWMNLALAEARQAADRGEIPVGAVVIRQGQILGRGHNQVERLQDPTAHAEVLALGAAAGTTGGWRLADTTLYVTLEPCTMCCGALLLARVPRLVFGAADPRAGAVISTARLLAGNPYQHEVQVIGGIQANECGYLLQEFFRRRRK